MSATLSVVIVNYNTCDFLRGCLRALAASTYPAEIIVVDNASSDGSVAMVKAEFPQVRLVEPNKNTWFCGGNNRGIAAATGEYVLLLNPDTEVQPESLRLMMAFMQAHPDYAGATMQLRYPDGGIQRTCSRRITLRYLLISHTVLTFITPLQRAAERDIWYPDWARDTDYDVETMPGSCTLMRREDIGYDEALLLYFPEDALAARFAGRKFRFLTGAFITHHEKSATKSWRAVRIYWRDLGVFVRNQYGLGWATLLWVLSRPLFGAQWARWNLR